MIKRLYGLGLNNGLYKMSQHFSKPQRTFGGNIKVELDLSSYATKGDFNKKGNDTSKMAGKSDLASLKAEVDKLDIDKLVPLPVDLSKLSDVVQNVVKKTVYYKLLTKVNNIDTRGFVLKTKYDTGRSELEKKIPDTSGLAKKLDYTATISKIESKIL